MTRSETTLAIRKVLVALDASRQSRLALDAAARLAQWHQAELQGLYVEDIDLVRLATLPVGQEIGQASPLPLKLDSRRLARRFSGGAAEAERWLAETAGRRNVRWTFRVERGEVTSVIAQAAGGADVVALGRAGTGTSGPGRLGSTARAIATGQTQSVILIQAPLPAGETVVALFDGSEACARSVRTSALLCERLDARLVILVPISDPTEPAQRSQLMEEAAGLVKTAGVPVVVRSVASSGGVVVRAIQAESPALCVVACQPESTGLIRRLTDQLRVSVFLIR